MCKRVPSGYGAASVSAETVCGEVNGTGEGMFGRATIGAALVVGALVGGSLGAGPSDATAGGGAGAAASGVAARTTTTNATTSRHFIVNLDGSTAPKRFGFNLFDTGIYAADIQALPTGVKAIVWLGQKCPTPATSGFKSTIRRMAKYQRVFGYYLSDEPHLADCPGGPKALASRADFIRTVTGGAQKSMIVLDKHDGSYADYTNFRPQVTHVSLFGLDAYPCNLLHATCELSKINERVNAALSRGFPLGRIVPVYQAFGQGRTSDPYYRMPTATELRQILARWASLVPHPVMDYAYTWGHQDSANPTLRDSTALQGVFKARFVG